jgi:two-component system cell cycle response regulator DivK
MSASTPASTPTASTPAILVVVEADVDSLQLLQRVLETTGLYLLHSASDGHSGLEQIQLFQPDLVLCELDLPVINGFELFKRIRTDPDLDGVPVIAVTGAVMKGERQRCLQMGFSAFIEKPFDINELRRVVAECLGA